MAACEHHLKIPHEQISVAPEHEDEVSLEISVRVFVVGVFSQKQNKQIIFIN